MKIKKYALVLITLMIMMGLPSGVSGISEVTQEPLSTRGESQFSVLPDVISGKESIDEQRAMEIFQTKFPVFCQGKDLKAELTQDRNGKAQWKIYSQGSERLFGTNEQLRGQVNILTGEITELFYQPGADFYQGREVSITRDDAAQIAQSFLHTMIPDRVNHLKLRAERSSFPYVGLRFQNCYMFNWGRMENGIKVEGDLVQVGIDAYTGMVTRYECVWQDEKLDPPEKVISMDQVSRILQEEAGLYLGYFPELKSDYTSGEINPYYKLNTVAAYIDADTGKLLDHMGMEISPGKGKIYDSGFTILSRLEQVAEPAINTKASPEESKQAARQFLARLGYTGEVQITGRGSGGGPGFREEYTSYSLKTKAGEPYIPIDVEVDDYTGKVKGFSCQNNIRSENQADLNYDQAREVAWEAINTYSPDKASLLVLGREPNISRAEPDNYTFRFIRLMNGLPLDRDQIFVTIDRYSGSVTRYSEHWHPVQYQSIDSLIPASQAWNRLQTEFPLELIYLKDRNREFIPIGEFRVVYKIPLQAEVNAITGKTGDRYGMMSENMPSLVKHSLTGPLSLIQENNLVPPDLANQPEAPVTRRQALKSLVVVSNQQWRYINTPEDMNLPFVDVAREDPDMGVVKTAVHRGIIPAQGWLGLDEPISRQELAVWITKTLGYDEVGRMRNSIQLIASDVEQVAPDKRNYVAVLLGLGIMENDANNCFRPREATSLAELAQVVTRMAPRLATQGN